MLVFVDVSSFVLRLHACVNAFMWMCVRALGPLPVWLLDRVAWACLWLWLSDCPSGMKPAALLGRLNCWGRASAGASSTAKAKWNYTTDLTLQVVCRILLKSMDSVEKCTGWVDRVGLIFSNLDMSFCFEKIVIVSSSLSRSTSFTNWGPCVKVPKW